MAARSARDGRAVEPLLGLVTFGRLPDKVLVRLALTLLLVVALTLGSAPANAAGAYAALYNAPTVPTALAASATSTVSVTVTNTGTATWNASGANPVNLAYHWYDASGTAAVWDGARTPLGADVAPGGLRTIAAKVTAPSTAGPYQLRFALVKEGVQWFDPEPVPHPVTITSAYASSFGSVILPAFVAGGTATVNVPVTNAGSSTWNASGAFPIDLAYHWLDAAGTVVVWDGVRSAPPRARARR